MPAPAYTLHNAMPDGSPLTFCETCAFRATSLGIIFALGQVPKDMDDAIAMIYLAQVSNGMPLDAPVAVSAAGKCQSCDSTWDALDGAA